MRGWCSGLKVLWLVSPLHFCTYGSFAHFVEAPSWRAPSPFSCQGFQAVPFHMLPSRCLICFLFYCFFLLSGLGRMGHRGQPLCHQCTDFCRSLGPVVAPCKLQGMLVQDHWRSCLVGSVRGPEAARLGAVVPHGTQCMGATQGGPPPGARCLVQVDSKMAIPIPGPPTREAVALLTSGLTASIALEQVGAVLPPPVLPMWPLIRLRKEPAARQ